MMRDLPPIPMRTWVLSNFKSVCEADLQLAHLNVLVGANSSGKSSLIQSILTASQAASAPAGSAYPLNGPLVRLGTFSDLLHVGGSARTVTLGGSVEVAADVFNELELDIDGRHLRPRPRGFGGIANDTGVLVTWRQQLASSAQRTQSTATVAKSSLHVELESRSTVSFVGRRRRPPAEDVDAFHRYGLSEDSERAYTVGFAGTVRSGGGLTERVSFAGAVLQGGLPSELLVRTPAVELLVSRWVILRGQRARFQRARSSKPQDLRDAAPPTVQEAETAMEALVAQAVDELMPLLDQPLVEATREIRYLPSASGRAGELPPGELHVLRTQAGELRERIRQVLGPGEPVLYPYYSPATQVIVAAANGVRDFLANRVRYLGPLREDPQVVYRSAGSARPGDIGPKGEFAAAVLHSNAQQMVRMPLEDGTEEPATLQSSLNHWLRRIGAADEISTEDRGALGIYVRVTQRGLSRPVDLTSVGVGVSQLLPVLMMCLLADPGDLLMLEQPELHLHPALQQELADFLLACARNGRQLIIETHSEYVISRLRKRIAMDRSDTTLAAIQFLFVERDAENGSTSYRPVATNRYGGIETWPRDFFAQSPLETQEIVRQGLLKSDVDDAMVVAFIFDAGPPGTEDVAVERVLEALTTADLEGIAIALDVGRLLPRHEVQRQRDPRDARRRGPNPPSPHRRRALERLAASVGWRSGKVDDLLERGASHACFVVRAVGIPLDVAESIDSLLRRAGSYIGAFELMARSQDEMVNEVEESLVRRFEVTSGRLTVFRSDLSADDAEGIVEAWRRADLFRTVVVG